ncbi:3-hydroxyanthranilate 3,4-dioxygenase [Sinisalibacter aestuarii]|nr:hypothetical protein [Sinisalibacter aestuarii]
MKMPEMPNLDLQAIVDELRSSARRTKQLWLNDDSLAFVARGREYRSEFHVNPSYEIQYSLIGDLHLHYRTPEGKEEVAVVPEGSCLYQPAMVPHSPRFGPDSFQLVIERSRKPGEVDQFNWYCPACDELLHTVTHTVDDYKVDPVSRAYEQMNASEEIRTCKSCGNVMPVIEMNQPKISGS